MLDWKSLLNRLVKGRASTLAHLLTRIIIMVVIFVQLNYLGCRRYTTADLSRSEKFTLSDLTQGFIETIDSDVKVITAFLASSDVLPEVKAILGEYDRVGGDRLQVEHLDLSRSRDRIAELRESYKLKLNVDQVVVIGNSGRVKVLNAEEIVRRDSDLRIVQFNGEEKLTSAILEVTEDKKKKVYLIRGKRRGDELSTIYAQLTTLLNSQNGWIEDISLEGFTSIPADADALIFAGITTDLTVSELKVVREFWEERKGGLLILLDPEAETPNLSSILADNGVIPNPDRVMTVKSIPGMALQATSGVVPATILPGRGPTRDLPILELRLVDRTQSLTVRTSDELYLSKNIVPSPILAARKDFWGETEYGEANPRYDPERDNGDPDPVITAAAIERGETNDPEFRNGASRLVVVGNPNLISPRGNYQKTATDFTAAAINWVMNRDKLLGIAPRQPTRYYVNLTDAEFSLVQSLIVWVFPAVLLFCGALVWYRRRA